MYADTDYERPIELASLSTLSREDRQVFHSYLPTAVMTNYDNETAKH